MRVLHLLSSTGYHGAENMAAELIRQLSARGVDNRLGVFRSSDRSSLEILDVMQGHINDGTIFDCRGRLDLRTVLALRKYIVSQGIDIIHSHKYKTNLYAYLANIGLNRKLFSTCHNWLGDSISMRFYAWLDKRILRKFDWIAAVSNEIRDELKKHVSPEKIIKVDNGIDVQKFKRQVDSHQAKLALKIGSKPVIGFVGRLSPEKGIGYLLRAVSNLIKEGLDVCVIIVGDGEQTSVLKQEAQELQIAERVVFAGNQSDTPKLYAAMDVFVLPSLQEAFPMVILEAMACGIPVVATRVGDVAEIIEPGTTGLLVEARDVAGLQNAIKELLTHKDAAERMSQAARTRTEQKFSSVAMANQYYSLYQRVMGIELNVAKPG